jgi:bifunctional DNA-binding transcriptional regulator/antitoxin component of YhaV-PrlF toxin-antitoxin module
MNYTTTLISTGQITIPAWMRRAAGIKRGTSLEVYSRLDGNFEGRVIRPSRIMDFAGDLAELDH